MAAQEQAVIQLGLYVRHALSDKLNHESDHAAYYGLLKRVSDLEKPGVPPETLILLKVLSQNVSHLNDSAHENLLQKILSCHLWNCTEKVAQHLAEFAVNLVSVSTGCMHACVDMLVRAFAPPLTPPPKPQQSDPTAAGDNTAPTPDITQEAAHRVVVGCLRRILALVPTSSTVLLQVVLRRVPHKRLDVRHHTAFWTAAFRLAESSEGEVIREEILLGCVDALLQVDVEIKWEDIVTLEEEDEAHHLQHQQAGGQKTSGGRGGGDDDDEDEDDDLFQLDELHLDDGSGSAAARPPPAPVDETADKLDSMMEVTLSHLQAREAAEGGAGLNKLFATLLRSFSSALLHTYRSKFTQFLLFYACARDSSHQNSAAFISALLTSLQTPSAACTTRLAATAYLASFLGRAGFLPSSTLTQPLHTLIQVCISLLEAEVPSSQSPQGARAASDLPASLCQAVLYVLCYRLRSLDAAALKPLKSSLTSLLHHASKPLRRCLPSVAHEFLLHASEFCLLSTSEISALHSDLNLSSQPAPQDHHLHHHPTGGLNGYSVPRSSVNNSSAGIRPLDSFFPFDPYLLRRSNTQMGLSGSYIRWGAPSTLAWNVEEQTRPRKSKEDGEDEASSGYESSSEDNSEEDGEDGSGKSDFRFGSVTPSKSTPQDASFPHGSMGRLGIEIFKKGDNFKPADNFAAGGYKYSYESPDHKMSSTPFGTTPLDGTPMSCTPDMFQIKFSK